MIAKVAFRHLVGGKISKNDSNGQIQILFIKSFPVRGREKNVGWPFKGGQWLTYFVPLVTAGWPLGSERKMFAATFVGGWIAP